jgi:predicted O-linked N-acetylglucosamine transferase (SPINDLY family)
MACAVAYTRERHPAVQPPLWNGERYRHDRIRLAYLSADFHEHATAYLMAELFELHDRARFEVSAISFGPNKRSRMRTRLRRSFERFIDVRAQSDHEVASLVREMEIDIAVDLKGFTTDSRTGILAYRAAPIQVNYLGFPGTMGADYIDYILADRVVIPEEHQPCYTEKVVYLPDSYQVNDSRRSIAERTPSRAEAGLPERGFVFCCFNNNYKITPAVFDVWMRLLRQVPDSVLWLLEANAVAASNLRREAQARGVEPERLVFAKRAKLAEHLARHRLADLFLDTLPYNAHTTASDALWTGVPVLTRLGSSFAGRVAASLLRAVGLPELIARSVEEYEALALELATDPALLRQFKDRLAANHLTAPLFDTARFTRHIEAAYTRMWEIGQRGEVPRSLDISPAAPSLRRSAPAVRARVHARSPEAHLKRALAQARQNRHAEALASFDQALALQPDHAEAHYRRGNALRALGRNEEAVASYDRALALKSGYVEAFNNRGNALQALDRHQEAIASYDQAIALRPEHVSAWYNRGTAYARLNLHIEAARSFDRALELDPEYHYAAGNAGYAHAHACNWRDYDSIAKRLTSMVRRGRFVMPFSFLPFSDSPADQYACALSFARAHYPPASPPLSGGEPYRHDRIRVAYLSSDFREHAIAWLMAGLFERHDRRRFETTAVSFGPERPSATRTRLERSFERFIDVRGRNDRQIAELLRELEVDIAVDLMGYTTDARTGIFAYRPAPIQVNYLGYPGTMGADYIDYILADRVVIPGEHQGHYTEKVVYLPDSYQVNDSKRSIAERTPSRTEAGLPELGFVFCCFNNSYKITPAVFDAWMRLLNRV